MSAAEAARQHRPGHFPLTITSEGVASEYQPISASGSWVRISVAVAALAGSWSTVAS